MNYRRGCACSLLLSVALMMTAVGCGMRTVRCYVGEKRPPTQVARVYTTADLHLSAVDGLWTNQLSGGDQYYVVPPKKVIELLPGEHRLTVFYRRDRGSAGYYIAYEESENFMTIRHAFEAGKEYTFAAATISTPTAPPSNSTPGLQTPSGIWQPLLVEKGSGNVIGRLETGLPATSRVTAPPPPSVGTSASASKARGATISGFAALIDDSGRMRTSAGRNVVLMRKQPRDVYWIEKRVWEYHHRPIIQLATRSELARPAAKLGGRFVQGFGSGQFEFHNVLPGDYLILFEFGNVLARADVVVQPGQSHVNGVELSVVPKPTRPPVKPR